MQKQQNKYLIASLLFSSALANSRTITFRNLCSEPVWYGFAGGSVGSRSTGGASTQCNSDGDCYQGSACIQTGNIRQCFWQNPTSGQSDEKVNSGSSVAVQIPIYDNGLDFVWSGAITGRTGCDSGVCTTADCGNGTGSCKPSQGFMQPATQAEFTMSKSGKDFYDVEVINGFHLPLSITPQVSGISSDDVYFCGAPGSKHPITQVGACNWNMNPPSNDFKWVTMGGNGCNSDSDCGGSTCGISFNPGHSDLLQKTCGSLLGYWTADQICSLIPSYGAPFYCSNQVPGEGLTNTNLYACTGTDSCYSQSASAQCCGCVNWDEEGVNVPSYPKTQKCVRQNSEWHSIVFPKLEWLKQACPTAYTYPFDDMSSTFTCSNAIGGGMNTVNYEITFCPQNESNEKLFLE